VRSVALGERRVVAAHDGNPRTSGPVNLGFRGPRPPDRTRPSGRGIDTATTRTSRPTPLPPCTSTDVTALSRASRASSQPSRWPSPAAGAINQRRSTARWPATWSSPTSKRQRSSPRTRRSARAHRLGRVRRRARRLSFGQRSAHRRTGRRRTSSPNVLCRPLRSRYRRQHPRRRRRLTPGRVTGSPGRGSE